ncbi:hypothetical protein [Dendronalium phyllosphericum]|nr:hypothetical protein [Dendronalium phyllosphericum]
MTNNFNNKMTNLTSTNSLLIAGIVFLTIAVIGQSKLGFLEINPGCFGRLLALSIGVLSLAFAFGLGNFPVESLDLFRNFFTNEIQQNISALNDLLQGS